MKIRAMAGAAGLAAVLSLTTPALASTYTLEDANSTAVWNDGSNGSTAQFTWTVDGVDQVFDQDFFFRIGDTDAEARVGTLDIDFAGVSNTNSDAGDDVLTFEFSSSAGLHIDISYKLRGGIGGSGVSDLAETITITNLTGASIDLSFFQYVDFDLGATISDDRARLLNNNTIRQWDAGHNVAETVVTPGADEHEIDFFSNTLTKLTDNDADDLDSANLSLGPGDVTWAFQWDRTLQNNASFQISKDKRFSIVPLPPAALAGLGLLGLLGVARMRRRKQI